MRRRTQFRVLWFGQFSSVAGLTVVVPLMPFYLGGLGTAPGDVPLWTGVSLAAPAAAQIVSAQVADYTPYVVAGLLFVVLAIPCIRFVDWYSARLRRREQIGSIV